jgi:hypothetical protein
MLGWVWSLVSFVNSLYSIFKISALGTELFVKKD